MEEEPGSRKVGGCIKSTRMSISWQSLERNSASDPVGQTRVFPPALWVANQLLDISQSRHSMIVNAAPQVHVVSLSHIYIRHISRRTVLSR